MPQNESFPANITFLNGTFHVLKFKNPATSCKIYTGWVKNSVIYGAWYKSVPFSVQLFCMVFFKYFLKIVNFFWYSNGPKKIRELFFLSKAKVLKSKNVYIIYFYQNLKFYKDWITESQKIGKIVTKKIRNFQFWSNF